MTPTTGIGPDRRQRASAAPDLEELTAIAVVIAAGCERCAEKAVRRALGRGCAPPSIARTLALVEQMHGLDCLVQAVGPEVARRMERPLAAARRVLAAAEGAAEERPCCQ